MLSLHIFMTDGTSQGLFIVVAIVIFGIFVVLAYILFEDTLSPAMASMFTQATEQAQKPYKIQKASLSDFYLWTFLDSATMNKGSKELILESTTESNYISGVYLLEDVFEPNKEYVAEFTYKVLSGDVEHIGGHLAISTDTTVYVDGKQIDGNWHVSDTQNYPKDNREHKVRIRFNSNRYNNPINSVSGEPTSDRKFYIQPNRYRNTSPNQYKISIKDFKLYEN